MLSALGVCQGYDHALGYFYQEQSADSALLTDLDSLFGGLTGAFVGANAWTALNTAHADAHWAGAAMGFILMAMASFLMFRMVVVLFTSIGGAAMAVFGAIVLLLQVDSWQPAVRSALTGNQMILPLLLAVAAVGGFVLQSSWHPETIAKANGGDE